MAWIKITDVGTPDYINLDQLYKIEADAAAFSLTFWDANSVLPTTYTFANYAAFSTFINKLEKIINTIDIDFLAPQG
jgi:hypothetical protein